MNIIPAGQANTNTNQLLRESLAANWKQYRIELRRCRDEFSNEAVHDLRSATRRTLAILKLLNSVSPRPRLQKLIRAFKNQLDEFNELRDIQVILAEISEIRQELPQLEGFQKHLQAAEERLLRVLRKKLKKHEITEVARRVHKTLESLEAGQGNRLEQDILQAVDDAYLLTQQRLEWVDSTRSTTIHRVRIAFKPFRYMVEIVHPLLSRFPAQNLEKMHHYQALMGEIQDSEVFAQTLTDFAEYTSPGNLGPVRRYYESRHSAAVSTYIQEMNQLHDFWRPAPDQPYPWENGQ